VFVSAIVVPHFSTAQGFNPCKVCSVGYGCTVGLLLCVDVAFACVQAGFLTDWGTLLTFNSMLDAVSSGPYFTICCCLPLGSDSFAHSGLLWSSRYTDNTMTLQDDQPIPVTLILLGWAAPQHVAHGFC
jgi:hypothetical protein